MAQVVVEEVWENQRSGLFGKFATKWLLPPERPAWSEQNGAPKPCKEDIHLPGVNWEWKTPWTICTTGRDCDAEGWEYAINWNTGWMPTVGAATYVRRRKWVRTRALTNSEVEAIGQIPAATNSAPNSTPTSPSKRLASQSHESPESVPGEPTNIRSPTARGVSGSTSISEDSHPDSDDNSSYSSDTKSRSSTMHLSDQPSLFDLQDAFDSSITSPEEAYRAKINELNGKLFDFKEQLSRVTTHKAKMEKELEKLRKNESKEVERLTAELQQVEVALVRSHGRVEHLNKAYDAKRNELLEYLKEMKDLREFKARTLAANGVPPPVPVVDVSETQPSRIRTIKLEETDIVYENQRSGLFGAYSVKWLIPKMDQRGEWSLEDDSNVIGGKDAIVLPDDSWQWTSSTWEFEKTDATDNEGWSYAFSWWDSTWSPQSKPQTFVRRRKWKRVRTKTTTVDESELENVERPSAAVSSTSTEDLPQPSAAARAASSVDTQSRTESEKQQSLPLKSGLALTTKAPSTTALLSVPATPQPGTFGHSRNPSMSRMPVSQKARSTFLEAPSNDEADLHIQAHPVLPLLFIICFTLLFLAFVASYSAVWHVDTVLSNLEHGNSQRVWEFSTVKS
ncbi:hypothetical protein CAOG_000827 [Capsaspora owczarzaki ATCC 30864]|uniref:Peroxin/Ferlin domain-containing protein n=1 Tax=Capsaspora owczarzaki (strain ATCC 30864) TaxID=595528 RepID=A0A0D2VHA5_CAPO3|nr:hypothetical protein CAOG_000827 [Capsaspora owczarzaki ATCC 30864]